MPVPMWFLVVVTIGVALMAVAMLVQLGLLLGLYLRVLSVQQKAHQVLDHQVQPLLSSAKSIADQAQRLGDALEEITNTVRGEVAKVDEVLSEATDRARLAIVRIDEAVADAVARFDETTSYLQRNIIKPVQEMQAVVHGVSRALGFFFRQRRNPRGVTQDEELFI